MKYILFTDIHFGAHSNAQTFNQECLDFLNYVKDYVDEHYDYNEVQTFFLGDWYHSRNTVNVQTLNYAKEGLITLSNIGSKQYMLLGNHDLYYLQRRDVTSVIIPEEAAGIEVIYEPIYLEKEKILICPWLIENENLKELINQYEPRIVMGHFEIPSFSYNHKIKMEGEFDPSEYQGPQHILSGHFHMRQSNANITYIGNCFSHDFSDANDWHNKGFAILDSENGEIEYVEWKDGPKYCVSKVSELQSLNIEPNTKLKLINDVGLGAKQINEISEQLLSLPNIQECLWFPTKIDLTESGEDVKLENIDNVEHLIAEMLTTLDMENIKNDKLISIYNDL